MRFHRHRQAGLHVSAVGISASWLATGLARGLPDEYVVLARNSDAQCSCCVESEVLKVEFAVMVEATRIYYLLELEIFLLLNP